MMSNLITIERKEGVTIFGRVIDKNGRLGQFEVYSDILGNDGNVYCRYKDAEIKMSALVGFHNDTSGNKQQKR